MIDIISHLFVFKHIFCSTYTYIYIYIYIYILLLLLSDLGNAKVIVEAVLLIETITHLLT